VSSQAGGAGCARDEVYDDERELAKYAAHPTRALTVPDDIERVTLPRADPVDPTLLDVSLGPREIRVHGRVAATSANDGGFGTSDGLLMTEITSMLD